VKQFPWLSLALLLIAYTSFGWFLCNPQIPLLAIVCAIAWVWVISAAFMHPIIGLNRFITRWFHSDTIAFLTLFALAGLVTTVLFFLRIFLYIFTILATEALARIDMQTLGYREVHAFWILATVSFLGLILGWVGHYGILNPDLLTRMLPVLHR
jgi:hypothetical protein